MLILSRRIGEEFVFRIDDLEFTEMVTSVRGRQVKLSVEAPKDVEVLRDELLDSP